MAHPSLSQRGGTGQRVTTKTLLLVKSHSSHKNGRVLVLQDVNNLYTGFVSFLVAGRGRGTTIFLIEKVRRTSWAERMII